MPLKDNTQETKKFIELFQGRLEELINTDNLPPGMAIAILANLNFHGQDMPASVFRRLNYDKGWETPEDPIILAEAKKRIKDGKVIIDKTTRTPIGEFQLQYNFVRGFRPKREARRTDIPLDLPFDPKKFNYGFDVVDPEVFIEGVKYDKNLTVDFVFNRYPFAPYHFLWVPNRKNGEHNQYIDAEENGYLIEAAWDFVTNQGFGKGIRLCYNSNGAHASVNHFHLQGFFLTQDWEPPFEKVIKRYRQDSIKGIGEIKYVQTPEGEAVGVKKIHRQSIAPSCTIDCYFPGTRWISASDGVNGLKKFVDEMNQKYANGEKIAFNFCMAPEGIACFPRKHQGNEKYFQLLQKSPFTTGYAFFEMLGEIISPTADVPVTENQIRELYNVLSLK